MINDLRDFACAPGMGDNYRVEVPNATYGYLETMETD